MSDLLTQDELERKYGATAVLTRTRGDSSDEARDELERKYGLTPRKKAKSDEVPAETDSFIGQILEKSLKGTSVGILGTTTGALEAGPGDLGTAGNIAAGIGGFVLDPATYLTGGLGNIIGKTAAKKLVTYAAKKGLVGATARAAPHAISAGVQLGGLEATREAAAGEFHPTDILKATAAGAAFGPAGLAPKGLRTAAEVGAMAVPPALLEGRLPNKEDWINAAGTVGGFKLYRAVKGAIGRLKPDATPEEVKAAVETEVGPEETARIYDGLMQAGIPRSEVERGLESAGTPTPTAETGFPTPRSAGDVVSESMSRPEAVSRDAGVVRRPLVESQNAVSEAAVPRETPANAKLAALADKPTVSRKEYAAAVGIKEGHVPVAADRKAAAVAEAEKLKQEIAGAEQGRGAVTREAPAIEGEGPPAEAAAEIGPPQAQEASPSEAAAGRVGSVEIPPELVAESPKIAAARAKVEARVEEYRKHTQGKLFAGVDPKSAVLLAKAFKAELDLGWAKFSDYVASLARRFGAAVVRTHATLIRDTWESNRKENPALESAGDVEVVLAETKAPEAPTEIARPDLAVPVQGETAKAGLNVADTIRSAAGEPKRETFAEWDAEGNRRIEERGPELTQRLIKGGWEAADPADVRAQIKVLTALGKQAAETRNWKDLSDATLNYRGEGTNDARVLAARRAIEDLNQPDQQAFFNQRALVQPPREVEQRIRKAQAREQRERSEQPSVDPGAPEGFKAPKGDAPPKEQTPRQKAVTEKRRAKTAEGLKEAWANEIEKVRAKLAGLGHNVDAALRGELDPNAQREFIRDAHAVKASKSDQLYEWWSNSILSGPATQVTNAVGNVAHSGWHFTAERITDAFVSSIARASGLKSDGARFGEFKYIARAFVENLGKSADHFWETWHSEVPQFYKKRGLEERTPYEYRPGSIPGKFGKAVRTPWRLLAAVDDFVKWQSYETERAALAYRKAAGENLKGGRLTERMRELLENPDSELGRRAADTAIRLAFQGETPLGKKVGELRDLIPGDVGRYLLPFITTPFNILKTGVRKSPFGSIKLATEVLKAQKSGDWSSIHPRVAEQVLAWGATLALAYSNDPKDPWITGEKGNRPYSVKIGGQWYGYGRIEPFATTIGLMVDGINKIHQGADVFEAMKAPFDALLGRIDNQTFFTGLSDFTKAARYQDANYVLEFAAKFPASWVPNLVRAPLRAAADDTPQRRVWGKGAERSERMLKRGLQQFEVMPDYPKYDLWGRTAPKDGSPIPHTDWLWRTLSPVGERRYVETIGDRMITRWNAAHPEDRAEFKPPNPYYTENGKTTYFTDAENAMYVRESGKLTQQRIIAAQANSPFNVNDPKERDIERLRKIIESSRKRIRNTIKRARRKDAA